MRDLLLSTQYLDDHRGEKIGEGAAAFYSVSLESRAVVVSCTGSRGLLWVGGGVGKEGERFPESREHNVASLSRAPVERSGGAAWLLRWWGIGRIGNHRC
jgi:hypothetical protein